MYGFGMVVLVGLATVGVGAVAYRYLSVARELWALLIVLLGIGAAWLVDFDLFAVWGLAVRDRAIAGASRVAVTFPLSSRVRCTIPSSRSGTAHAAVPQSGHSSLPVLSSRATSSWATAPSLTAARQACSPTAASPPKTPSVSSRSRRATQASMTGPASSRTLAGVSVCGSAVKIPAKLSRTVAGSFCSRLAMPSWCPPIASYTADAVSSLCRHMAWRKSPAVTMPTTWPPASTTAMTSPPSGR